MSKTRSGAPRRVAAGLLAGALTVFGLALAAPAGAVEGVVNDRVAGADRFGTAAAACTEAYEDGTGTVIIATARNFPDALAASSLAGENDACILLVEVSSVPPATVAAIDDLGASNAIIVGGTDAVSQAVVDFLEDEVGVTTSRVAGLTRFDTAAEIGGELSGICDLEDSGPTAILASGRSSADALAAGPLAFAGDGTNPCPILLTEQNDLPQATVDAIDELGITNIIVVGGTGVISEAVRDEAGDLAGDDDVTVLAGTDRNKTAVAIANFEIDELGWAPTTVCLANSRKVASAEGADFGPDALTGGPLCGLRQAPILLVVDKDNLGADTEGFIDDHSDTIEELLILGGTAVISDIAEEAAVDAAENTENDDDDPAGNQTVTVRPELVSASIVQTTTASNETATNPRGTTVRYCFDEAVTGSAPVSGNFHLYTSSGTQISPSSGGPGGASGLGGSTGPATLAAVASDNNHCVNVFYGAQATPASVANVTLATVDAGAVADAGGTAGSPQATSNNPEGDAPLTPAGAGTALASGVTDAPDLVSVGNFRAGSTVAVTAVDFTFDEAAFTTPGADFELVLINNTISQCTVPAAGSEAQGSGGTVPGGRGTTTITATCINQGSDGTTAGTALSATNVARGVVHTGSVGDLTGGGNLNPLEAAEVAAGGVSTGPDLDSVQFLPDAVANVDVVVYTFDEAVNLAPTASLFRIYRVNGSEATGTSATRSTENNRVVSVTFADNALVNSVGASVSAGAVSDVDLNGGSNQPDEVAATPTSGTVVTSGRTDGPDLIEVRSETYTTGFGAQARRIVYVFDEDLADTAFAPGSFFAYTSDGIRLTCSTISPTASSDRTEELDNTVTCTAFTPGTGTVGSATTAQIGNAVLGTVDNGAVSEETGGGLTNPEGAEVISGSTGTPAA